MFGFQKKKMLPIMYRTAKMYKNPTCTRVIMFYRTTASNVFKLMYSQLENFHKKDKFLSSFNNFLVLNNPDPNKSIATYEFLTLNTKPYDKLKSKIFIHF